MTRGNEEARCAEINPAPTFGRLHDCRCVLIPRHMERIPQAGHGCTCGAVWGRVPAPSPSGDGSAL